MNARCPKDRGSARGSSLITLVQGVALATARYVVSVQVNLLSLSLSLSCARARSLSLTSVLPVSWAYVCARIAMSEHEFHFATNPREYALQMLPIFKYIQESIQ
jgi:hypothetical protein